MVLALVVALLALAPRASGQEGAAAWPPPGVHAIREAGLTPPRLLREVKPRYSAAALRAKVQGNVMLEAVIDTSGRVVATRVVRSLDPTFGLDEQAVAALKQWTFAPAVKDGMAVSVLVSVDMSFRISDEQPVPMTLPEQFGLGAGAASWTAHMLVDTGWRIDVEIPSDWKVDPPGASASRLLRAASVHGHATRTIEVPALKPYGGRLEDLSTAGPLRQFAKTVETGLAYAHPGAELRESGRTTLGAQLWIWVEVQIPAPDGGVGDRMWVFSTTAGDRLLQVACSLTLDRGIDSLDIASESSAAGGVCLEILRRTTIGRAP